MVALSLWKVVYCRDFCHSNGWQPFHYGRQSVGEIFFTPMDGSLVIMEGSLLLIFLLLQWMVALSLWKVVCCRDFCDSNGLKPCHYARQYVLNIIVTPIDGSLLIIEGSLLLRFLLLHWMVALSLQKVVCCRYFCYSIGWQQCHYGRQYVVEILLLQWMVDLSLGRQSVVEIFVTPLDGSRVIMEGSLFSMFLLL